MTTSAPAIFAIRNDDRRELALFLLVALILIVAGIGLRDPWPADEPRFAPVAKQMSNLIALVGLAFLARGLFALSNHPAAALDLAAFYLVTLRASAIDTETLAEGSYDPYVFYRDAYRQRRMYKIYRGEPPPAVIQAFQGVNDIDADELLEEQHRYEQNSKSKDVKNSSGFDGDH